MSICIHCIRPFGQLNSLRKGSFTLFICLFFRQISQHLVYIFTSFSIFGHTKSFFMACKVFNVPVCVQSCMNFHTFCVQFAGTYTLKCPVDISPIISWSVSKVLLTSFKLVDSGFFKKCCNLSSFSRNSTPSVVILALSPEISLL